MSFISHLGKSVFVYQLLPRSEKRIFKNVTYFLTKDWTKGETKR